MDESMEHKDYYDALARIKRSLEWECSLVASTVVGVLRDRAVSSCYGRLAEKSIGTNGCPAVPYDAIFHPNVVKQIEESFTTIHFITEAQPYPLYGHESDLIGQLSRLLIVCKEGDSLDEETRDFINRRISGLNITTTNMKDGNYIRHLRNAVAHGRFGAVVDEQDPMNNSKLVFVDVNISEKSVTAIIEMNADQLNGIIDALIKGMADYLKRVGWIL